ncbi:MAG: hypothetical protein HKN16_06915 [Saprospiraceae bacterium]|nr:hypothetical protein [Saprospiraceae bacterium]
MENVTQINGSEIQNLITKFYYKENNLCFQILLHFGLDRTIPFQEFTDYAEYKKVYNDLLAVKNNDKTLDVPVEGSKVRKYASA